MRALIFDGKTARLDGAYHAPNPQQGEAIIRLVRAAVSMADLELCKGLLNFRGVLGQEFVGIVESVNGEGSGLVGKRVVASLTTQCGKCDMCLAGLNRHCRQRTILGMHGRGGCLAERFSLPTRNLAVVPESLDHDHAVFAVELAAALQAASQLTIVGKPYITVLGDTALGLLTAQVMSKLNASVRVLGSHRPTLAICEKWGIKHRGIDEIGMRADQDIVVECSGSAQGLGLAMRLVRPRGKIVLKSLYAALGTALAPAIDLTPIVMGEIELIGSFCGSVGSALDVMARGEVDVVSLISRRMGLGDGPAVLKAAGQPGIIKVLVDA